MLDHASGRHTSSRTPGDGRASVEERHRHALADLARAGARPERLQADALVRETSSAEHVARVQDVQALIAAGEVYQVNLAHRITARLDGSAAALFLALRRHNPAPYMGLVQAPEGAVVSSSPELLLECDRGRPLAAHQGHPARGESAEADAALRRSCSPASRTMQSWR